MSMLTDERGKRSTARTLLVCELVYLWGAGLLETFTAVEFSAPAWTLHGSLVIALVAWAAGPRAMQYLGPQVGRVGRAVADAAKDDRLRLQGRSGHDRLTLNDAPDGASADGDGAATRNGAPGADGDGAATRNGAPGGTHGKGLLGMRERVAVYGGELATAPGDGGGWQVSARLPVEATA